MPTLSHEKQLLAIYGAPIVGLDEAGRGPWAGPVVAGCVCLPEKLSPRLARDLDDSKKLSEAQREALFAEITATSQQGIGLASVAEIDQLNILQATFLAMRRAYEAAGVAASVALVDGNRAPPLPCATQTLIGGDGLSLSIAAASILAKVTRDRLMVDLAGQYPGYGWERNKGYGTASHAAALLHLGVSPAHRRSFAPVKRLLSI